MDSTLDDKLAEGQIASLEEQLSNFTREAVVSPSPLTSKTSRAPLATIHRLADWRHVAFVGSVLAATGPELRNNERTILLQRLRVRLVYR